MRDPDLSFLASITASMSKGVINVLASIQPSLRAGEVSTSLPSRTRLFISSAQTSINSIPINSGHVNPSMSRPIYTRGVTARRAHSTLSQPRSFETSSHRTFANQSNLHHGSLRQSASHTQRRTYAYKTIEEAKARHSSGPFSFRAGALFLVSGGGLIWYFQHEKARMDRQRIANQTKGIGKPKVGGPFELVDQDAKPFSSEELRGRYSLVSDCDALSGIKYWGTGGMS